MEKASMGKASNVYIDLLFKCIPNDKKSRKLIKEWKRISKSAEISIRKVYKSLCEKP